MSASWPGTLPQVPLREGYSDKRADNIIETAMETGPAKRRLRGTVAPRIITLQIRLTAAQVLQFNTFYDTTTAFGSLSFLFPIPPTGTPTLVHFKAHVVPTMIPSGADAIYTMTLEVDP